MKEAHVNSEGSSTSRASSAQSRRLIVPAKTPSPYITSSSENLEAHTSGKKTKKSHEKEDENEKSRTCERQVSGSSQDVCNSRKAEKRSKSSYKDKEDRKKSPSKNRRQNSASKSGDAKDDEKGTGDGNESTRSDSKVSLGERKDNPKRTEENTNDKKSGSETGQMPESEEERKERRQKRRAEREAKAVSKLVQRKLENYINREKREERFNPHGAMRTSKHMADLDLEYQLIVSTKLDRAKPKKEDKSDESDKKLPLISPRRTETSNQVTPKREVLRLSQYATEVYSSYPIEKLNIIHRYRPHSRNVQSSPSTGRVHNYTRHVGSALHGENYVQYYLTQGLHTGDKASSERLQKLSSKETEEDKSENTTPGKSDNKGDRQQRKIAKTPSRRNSSEQQISKTDKGDRKQSYESAFNCSASFAESDSDTANEHDADRSDKPQDDVYSDNFEQESIGEKSAKTDVSREEVRPASGEASRDSADDSESKSSKSTPTETKEGDAKSVQTYVSVEHAVAK